MKGKILNMKKDHIAAADGELWRRKRELCNPIFSDTSLSQIFDQHMHRIVGTVLQKWKQSTGTINASIDTRNMAFDAIAEAGFGLHIQAVMHPNNESVALMDSLIGSSNLFAGMLPKFLKHVPVIGEKLRKNEELTLKVKKWFEEMIKERKDAHNKGEIEQNIVTRLLDAENEEFSKFDDEDLLSESVVMLMAGHETTAKTLACT
jgi:cytochrome P450